MKRVLVVIALLMAAVNIFAAVQYEFRQTIRSDSESTAATDMTGRGVIDGDRSRVDFLSGNTYTPGMYVISTNGSRVLTFVDPAKKAYVEVNAGRVATAIGANRITISNKKIDLTRIDDNPAVMIAGLPTEHYRLSMNYNITVAFGTIPLTQTVHVLIDKWVTQAFGNIGDIFLAGGALRTGNPDLDELIDIENTRIKGFPLRQTVNTTTVNDQPQLASSQLKLSRSLTTTREMVITAIEPKATVSPELFLVPASYRKPEPLRDDTQKAPLQILSLQPPTQ
jgi:hypothetical protein